MLKNPKESSLLPQEVKVSLKNSLNVKVKKNEHREYRVSATCSSKTVKIVGLIADRTSRYSGARLSLSLSFSLFLTLLENYDCRGDLWTETSEQWSERKSYGSLHLRLKTSTWQRSVTSTNSEAQGTAR